MGEKTKLQEMLEKKEKIRQGGGEKKVAKQHGAGKLTARERIDLLFDPGTFQEYNIFMKHRCHDFGMEKVDTPAEGVVTGYGLIHGRGAFAFAHDFTVLGGAMGEMQGMKVKRIQELAMDAGVPLIGLNDSGGGRIQEGPATSYGAIFFNNVMASGVIPQISAIMGPCAGGTVYSPALTDFIFSVDKTSRSFITGPQVIKNVTGEVVDAEKLGGARTHNTVSGVSHFFCADDRDCIEKIKTLLSYLPPNCREMPPIMPCGDSPDRRCEMLNTFIPDNLKKAYDSQCKEVFKSFSTIVVLTTIDENWKEHLREMDDLRQSVQNATYEQKDPLLIYKFESFGLFSKMIIKVNRDVLAGFERLLGDYFAGDRPERDGVPSVRWCAEQLHLSANYFGDLVKKETGKSAQEYIQLKVIDIAKERIFDPGRSISEIAYSLGFRYPQHFTRLFKKVVGCSPNEYRTAN